MGNVPIEVARNDSHAGDSATPRQPPIRDISGIQTEVKDLSGLRSLLAKQQAPGDSLRGVVGDQRR